MKKLLTKLYQRILGITPTPNKTMTRDPSASASVSEPRPSVRPPASTTSGTERRESQSASTEAARPGGTPQSPLDTLGLLSRQTSQDARVLLGELMAQSPLLAGILKKPDHAKLSDEQIQQLLKVFQDKEREQILRDLQERKEKTNRNSSSSPIGGR